MIEGKYLYGDNDDLSKVFAIRRAVFVQEQGIREQIEFDAYDKMSIHGIISVAGKWLGTGRLLYDGEEYRISHVCVLRDERRKKYGDFLVRMLIDKAFLAGAAELVTEAALDTVPFYETIGFVAVSQQYMNSAGVICVELKLNKQTLCKECTK